MKSDGKKSNTFPSESRKIRKPLMEKKRRARINDSLETLKQILLESKTTLKESGPKKSGQRSAKLEKADILEMTVRYLQNLRDKINQNFSSLSQEAKGKEEVRVRPADSSCDGLKIGVTLVPTRLENGEIAFVVPSNTLNVKRNLLQKDIDIEEQRVWRPW